MKPDSAIRGSSFVFYLAGFGTLLSIPPSLAYNVYFHSSIGSLLFGVPDIGDFVGSSLVGQIWGVPGVILLGTAAGALGALEIVAGNWLSHRLRKGGILGIALTPPNFLLAIGFGLPGWYAIGTVWIVLLSLGWSGLRGIEEPDSVAIGRRDGGS